MELRIKTSTCTTKTISWCQRPILGKPTLCQGFQDWPVWGRVNHYNEKIVASTTKRFYDKVQLFRRITRLLSYAPTGAISLEPSKRLLNLKLYSHMVPWLEKFLEKRKQNQSAFFKSFTKPDIGGSKMCWSMTPTERIDFERTVTFTNVPSLKSLVIDQCRAPNSGPSLPLVFPDNFQLQSLKYWSNGRMQLLTHLLAQIGGLESSIIAIYQKRIKLWQTLP